MKINKKNNKVWTNSHLKEIPTYKDSKFKMDI